MCVLILPVAGESEETTHIIQRLLKDLHDFRDAAGRCTSVWVLQVLSLLAFTDTRVQILTQTLVHKHKY
jgi:hypothetical protein